jgi:hypothetical protein
MVREKTIIQAAACGEVLEEASRFSILGEELIAMHRARDMAEEKILSLVAKVSWPTSDVKRQRNSASTWFTSSPS